LCLKEKRRSAPNKSEQIAPSFQFGFVVAVPAHAFTAIVVQVEQTGVIRFAGLLFCDRFESEHRGGQDSARRVILEYVYSKGWSPYQATMRLVTILLPKMTVSSCRQSGSADSSLKCPAASAGVKTAPVYSTIPSRGRRLGEVAGNSNMASNQTAPILFLRPAFLAYYPLSIRSIFQPLASSSTSLSR
jgi:hypothetical protein